MPDDWDTLQRSVQRLQAERRATYLERRAIAWAVRCRLVADSGWAEPYVTLSDPPPSSGADAPTSDTFALALRLPQVARPFEARLLVEDVEGSTGLLARAPVYRFSYGPMAEDIDQASGDVGAAAFVAAASVAGAIVAGAAKHFRLHALESVGLLPKLPDEDTPDVESAGGGAPDAGGFL